LVQPRAMDRGKVKPMAVRRIGQKRVALRPGLERFWKVAIRTGVPWRM
jgi:hypothetical protein